MYVHHEIWLVKLTPNGIIGLNETNKIKKIVTPWGKLFLLNMVRRFLLNEVAKT